MKNLSGLGITLMILAGSICMSGCTQQQRAKQFGGTVEQTLAPGQKFVTLSWEQDHLWIATRPMHQGEEAETVTVNESSSFGVWQGTIILHEQK